MLIRVVVGVFAPRQAGSRALYTYSAPVDLQPGQIGFVPLGARHALGVAFRIRDVDPFELGFAPAQLRPFDRWVRDLILPPPVLSLVQFVAETTLCTLPEALAAALPPGIQERLRVVWSALPEAETPHELTEAQAQILARLRELENGLELPLKSTLERREREALRHLKGKGLASDQMVLTQPAERQKLPSRVQLTSDELRIDRFLTNEAHRKPAQAFALSQLQSLGRGFLNSQDVAALGEITEATLRALLKAGLLEPSPDWGETGPGAPHPNPDQAQAIQSIRTAIESRQPARFLLHGVTGSGKTEVYLQAAETALRLGRQILYLVPEIALTAQVLGQLRGRFGETVSVLHSNLSPSARLDAWTRIKARESSVVVGPRSALFAPIEDLGLIIVDEEHESSYKQDSTPRYQAHALVEHMADQHRCPVVFGSATPRCETRYAAEIGRYQTLELRQRAVPEARLPEVHIEDLKEIYSSAQPSLFSDRLFQAIQETLSCGNQAILFLNRRAYAPGLTCRDCGNTVQCPHCALALSLHRAERVLKCHHCDFQRPVPEACPTCSGTRIAPFGIGVEKVEEAVTRTFSGARVGRLDRDVTRRKGALEETLARFRSGELNVLVGTQMVAKGFDFPKVTLVGVIAADISLSVPEFRASERTYQLLSQVAGGAGRAQDPGQVVIQTLMPENPSIRYAAEHDDAAFYEATREERQFAGYPPFRRLINVLFTGEDRSLVKQAAKKAAERARLVFPSAEILGPTDCAIERLAGRWRRHFVLKLHPDAEYQQLLECVDLGSSDPVRTVLDVDPQSMM